MIALQELELEREREGLTVKKLDFFEGVVHELKNMV